MTADLLREAAEMIRLEWGPRRGLAWSNVQKFHLAVADWLDVTREHVASHDCEAHCEPDGCPMSQKAIPVARAYLWRDS